MHSSQWYPPLGNWMIIMSQNLPFSFMGISQDRDEHDKFRHIPLIHCHENA